MSQPYKCPACEGRKKTNGQPCITCDGTGVVWAPQGVSEAGELPGQDALDLTYRGSE